MKAQGLQLQKTTVERDGHVWVVASDPVVRLTFYRGNDVQWVERLDGEAYTGGWISLGCPSVLTVAESGTDPVTYDRKSLMSVTALSYEWP
jgi:hypothetical protein